MSQAKPTREERRRFDDYVVEWSLRQRSSPQIAAALGVSVGMVTASRARNRWRLDGKRLHRANAPLLPDPPRYDWLAAPPPKVQRSYEINSPLPNMESLLDHLRNSNALARLPYNIEEATDAGDSAWYLKFQIVGQDLRTYLGRMLQVMENEESFRQAQHRSSRDDLAATRTDGTGAGLMVEGHMPERGSGEMPGRLFRTIMGAWWAGIEMDEAFVARVSTKERAPKARVLRAIAEFHERLAEDPR